MSTFWRQQRIDKIGIYFMLQQEYSFIMLVIFQYENFLILGDLNYDMLVNEKCTALKEVCDIFDLTNMVVDPTCFTKGASPSLNDHKQGQTLHKLPNHHHTGFCPHAKSGNHLL
jgi:hypothetical protein